MSDACSDNPGLALCRRLQGYELDRDRPVPGWDIVDGQKPEKNPARKHMNGQWTMQNAVRHFEFRARPFTLGRSTVGILLSDMMVLDFDSSELYDKVVAKFPEMEQTVRERTKKGMHIFFMRTPLVEELSLLDGARQFFGEEDGVALKLDLKTITSTTTSGFIVVAPSPGKEWITSLLDEKPQPLPDRLARWLAAARDANPKLISGAGCSKGCSQAGGGPAKKKATKKGVAADVTVEAGTVVRLGRAGGLFVLPQVDLDAQDAHRQLGGLTIDAATDFRFFSDDLRSSYLFRDTSTRCPICRDPEGHTSQYVVAYTTEGTRFVSSLNETCARGGAGAAKRRWRTSVKLPFSAAARVEIMRRFEMQCTPIGATKVAVFASWARASAPELEKFFGAGFEMHPLLFFRPRDGASSSDTKYLVLRKPLDVKHGYELTVRLEPWHGCRQHMPEDAFVRVPVASLGGVALAAVIYGAK